MRQLNVKNKLRLIISLAVVFLAFRGTAQVVMPDQMKPGDTWGLIDVNELYGGFMQVDDTAALYAIDVQFVKKGMVVIVYDTDGNELNGIDTKSFMFVPPAGTWNYTSPFDIPAINQADFVPRESWTEVSIRPVAGVSRTDTMAVKALIFDGDTIKGFSTDPNFTAASDSLFPSQKAVQLFVDSIVVALRGLGDFDTLFADTAYITKAKFDFLLSDSLISQYMMAVVLASDSAIFNFSQIDSLLAQSASLTRAEIQELLADSIVGDYVFASQLNVDTAYIQTSRIDTLVSDSINTQTFIATYVNIDTAMINRLGVNYLTLGDRRVLSISNDTLMAGNDSTALVTEFVVKNIADSLYSFVSNRFAKLSQNVIEDTDDGNTYIIATEGDSLIFVNDGSTSMVINEEGLITMDTTLIIGGDSIESVANAGDTFATKQDSAKAVTSLLAVDSMITESGNNINFAMGTNKITRPGWPGVTGSSVNADNLEEFLQKLFFPMPVPIINTFGRPAQSTQTVDGNGNIVSSVGSISIPFSTWRSGAGFTLDFSVDNRTDAASDPSDELPAQAINTIKVVKGATDVGTYAIGDGTTDQAGSITIDAANVTINPVSTSANTFTLVVTDDYPNTNTLNVTVNMTQAIQARVNNVSITSPAFVEGAGTNANPYLVERDGSPVNFGLSYQIVPNDETVSSVIFTESTGVNAMTDITGLTETANITRTTESFTIENIVLTNQRVGIQVDGNEYPGHFAAAYTPYVKLKDRGYVGYLTNAQRLAPTAANVTAFTSQNGLCLLNYGYHATLPADKSTASDGLSITNGIGQTGFLCFAIPYSEEGAGKSFSIETYDLGTWSTAVSQTDIISFDIGGGFTVDYYVIYVTAANTSNGGTVKARIIEN